MSTGNEREREAADLRRSPRKTIFKRAAVIVDGAGRALPCIARNVSEHGARVTLNEAVDCPSGFKLRIDPDELYYCRLVWQDGIDVGAEFVDEAEARELETSGHPGVEDGPLPRLAGIVFNDGYTFMNCTLLALDDEGARIKPTDANDCPDGFRLACDSGPPRRATVVVRNDEELEVRFVK